MDCHNFRNLNIIRKCLLFIAGIFCLYISISSSACRQPFRSIDEKTYADTSAATEIYAPAVKEDTSDPIFTFDEMFDPPGHRPKSLAAIDTLLVDIKSLDSTFILDLQYATPFNFVGEPLYECPKCYFKKGFAENLVKAHREARSMGLRFILYDCYRPHRVQRKMWAIVQNPTYITDPAVGSMHNRASAVDLGLADSAGNPLDMGTAFDHFGPAARPSYRNLPKEVIENRRLLKSIMANAGLTGINSEWWHFSMDYEKGDSVIDLMWDCE